MQQFQQSVFGEGHDYMAGSPHLKHPRLRQIIVETLQGVIQRIADRQGGICRVLEVGAGHGTFTDHLVATGATVEVTEMSLPSAAMLQRRFRHNKAVTIIEDPDGSAASCGGPVDVVVCVSVLHHIPDYLSAVGGMLSRVTTGGAFVSFQDPLWYPRRTTLSRFIDRAAYLSWRITQGEFSRGVATTARRIQGKLDESREADMTEYHVVRNGIDEEALASLLSSRFASVIMKPYWSSQGHLAQTIGSRAFSPNTFALVAEGAVASQ
jgi:SAM-dependent methyltransferase